MCDRSTSISGGAVRLVGDLDNMAHAEQTRYNVDRKSSVSFQQRLVGLHRVLADGELLLLLLSLLSHLLQLEFSKTSPDGAGLLRAEVERDALLQATKADKTQARVSMGVLNDIPSGHETRPETRSSGIGDPPTSSHLVLVSLAERLELSLADDREDAGDVQANDLAARAQRREEVAFVSAVPPKDTSLSQRDTSVRILLDNFAAEKALTSWKACSGRHR